ncbi:hypothetical protein LTR16_012574, partial [Cryomyces antarcticus]
PARPADRRHARRQGRPGPPRHRAPLHLPRAGLPLPVPGPPHHHLAESALLARPDPRRLARRHERARSEDFHEPPAAQDRREVRGAFGRPGRGELSRLARFQGLWRLHGSGLRAHVLLRLCGR